MTYATITIEDLASTQPGRVIKVVKVTGQLDESNVYDQSQKTYFIFFCWEKRWRIC